MTSKRWLITILMFSSLEKKKWKNCLSTIKAKRTSLSEFAHNNQTLTVNPNSLTKPKRPKHPNLYPSKKNKKPPKLNLKKLLRQRNLKKQLQPKSLNTSSKSNQNTKNRFKHPKTRPQKFPS